MKNEKKMTKKEGSETKKRMLVGLLWYKYFYEMVPNILLKRKREKKTPRYNTHTEKKNCNKMLRNFYTIDS